MPPAINGQSVFDCLLSEIYGYLEDFAGYEED